MALSIGSTSAFLAACGGSSGGSEGKVNVLSWISYVDPNVKKLWREANPDIEMVGIAAESDQDMFTKLKAGGASQYDIVFCNAGWAPEYRKSGLTDVIDVTKVKGADNLYPVFREDTSLPFIEEPDQVTMYPNMWATLSMTWNTTVPFQPTEPYSWDQMWSSEIPENHVMIMGAPDDAVAVAGFANGVPQDRIYSMEGAELDQAAAKLKELKPFQLNPSVNAQFRNAIKSENAWIGLTSDLSAAPLINLEAEDDIAKSVVPKEGSVGWVDGPQLVEGAKNRENALKFIDFFASDPKLLEYLWKTYRFAQCNQKEVERILAGGGEDAAFLKSIDGDNPELAKELAWQRRPDDPKAWASAWDSVQAT